MGLLFFFLASGLSVKCHIRLAAHVKNELLHLLEPLYYQIAVHISCFFNDEQYIIYIPYEQYLIISRSLNRSRPMLRLISNSCLE
jgi:hypothetical protein